MLTERQARPFKMYNENTRHRLLVGIVKKTGETFERWISTACKFYLNKGFAHIEKTPEPFHITGKDMNGVVRGYYEKKDNLTIKAFYVTEQG